MKIKFKLSILQQAINVVSKGISSKTPAPSLTGILIKVENDQIEMISSNRELSIRVLLPVTDDVIIEESGIVLVPGKYFSEIVKTIDDEWVTINSFDSTAINVTTERSQFTLNILDYHTYPTFSFVGEGEPITFSAKELKKIIKQTAFAASNNPSRLVLTGVNFVLDGPQLKVAATDSYRLSEKVSVLEDYYQQQSINIPSQSLTEFNKILDLELAKSEDDGIKMYLIQNKALFIVGSVVVIIRLIEGSYPNVSAFYPKDYLLTATFDRSSMIGAVERASLLNENNEFNLIKLVFNEEKGVKLVSYSNVIGKTEEVLIPYFVSEGINFSTAFKVSSFLDALRAFETDLVSIKFSGELKPFILYSENDDSLSELILPVHTFN